MLHAHHCLQESRSDAQERLRLARAMAAAFTPQAVSAALEAAMAPTVSRFESAQLLAQLAAAGGHSTKAAWAWMARNVERVQAKQAGAWLCVCVVGGG